MTPHAFIDKARANQLLEKWAPVLDFHSESCKSIDNDHVRYTTAVLLENQEMYCENRAGVGGSFGNNSGGLYNPAAGQINSGDNYAQGDSRLPKVLIPMIRRTFPELISNEIVGVQPMSGPVGLAFALRYYYNSEGLGNGGVDVGSGTARDPFGHNVVGNAGGANNPQGSTRPEFGPNGGREAGYQFLDTRFTGTSSNQLTGVEGVFEFSEQDLGVAQILQNFEIQSNIPQLEVGFDKTSVEAGTRRIGGRWSVELEQDLQNMNGIDIDSEITNAMSYEIQADIDREMIVRMIVAALKGGAGGYSFWHPASADGRWLVERNRDFYQKLIIEANRIAVRNRRGSANFVVATPRVCSILEMLPEFQWVPVQGNVDTQPVGVAKIGTIGGRFTVYRDTRTEAQNAAIYGDQGYTGGSTGEGQGMEYALLGYKGPEYYDTGIVYCPYIPIMVQRTIGPNDFAPRVGLLTRYGVVDNIFGANLYYHVVIVQGLGTAFTPSSQSVYF